MKTREGRPISVLGMTACGSDWKNGPFVGDDIIGRENGVRKSKMCSKCFEQ